MGHAKHVRAVLQDRHGVECGLVTGDTPGGERDELLRRFRGEELPSNLFGDTRPPLKYLVNVGVLTTGFDAPRTDCVVLLRPTMSAGLYCQMTGRGFRLSPDKKDFLVLDYGGNILRHGPIDQISVSTAGRSSGSGQPPAKECPECRAVIAAGYASCPDCGYQFPPPDGSKHEAQASQEGILTGQVVDAEYEVTDVFYSIHTKRGADEDTPKTMRVDYQVGLNAHKSEWVCPEHAGWARQRFEKWRRQRSNDPLPSTAQQTVELAEWDFEILPVELAELQGAGFDMDLLAFNDNVKVEPRSNNAIAAGLSSFTNTHHQNFDVGRHPGKATGTTRKLRPKDRPLKNDFASDEEFDRLLDAWFGNIARVLEPGRGFYIWGGYANCVNYPPFLKKHGLYFSQALIWDKQHPVLTRKDFMGAHEWCFYGWKEGAAHRFHGPNNATDLWHVKKIPPQKLEHLTGKPADEHS